MPRVSKLHINKNVYRDLVDSFIDLIANLREKDQIKRFLDDFLTVEEKLMLSKRLVLAFMVEQKYSWDEIQDNLKVSKTTINLMKHRLSRRRGMLIGINNLVKVDSAGKHKNKEGTILKHIPPLTRSKKDMAKWLNR